MKRAVCVAAALGILVVSSVVVIASPASAAVTKAVQNTTDNDCGRVVIGTGTQAGKWTIWMSSHVQSAAARALHKDNLSTGDFQLWDLTTNSAASWMGTGATTWALWNQESAITTGVGVGAPAGTYLWSSQNSGAPTVGHSYRLTFIFDPSANTTAVTIFFTTVNGTVDIHPTSQGYFGGPCVITATADAADESDGFGGSAPPGDTNEDGNEDCGAWYHLACHFRNALYTLFVPTTIGTQADEIMEDAADEFPLSVLIEVTDAAAAVFGVLSEAFDTGGDNCLWPIFGGGQIDLPGGIAMSGLELPIVGNGCGNPGGIWGMLLDGWYVDLFRAFCLVVLLIAFAQRVIRAFTNSSGADSMEMQVDA